MKKEKRILKPEKRRIPKTYSLRELGSLLQEYEKTVSSMAARDFVRWIEAREKGTQ